MQRNRALVIGGSMAGLLAARVLSDHFDEVTILERDRLPEGAEQRVGVPHGRHAHALLAGGQRVIEKLFPGISAELIDEGAIEADALKDGKWFFEGAPLYQVDSGTAGILISRPLIEAVVRRRVRNLDRVSIAGGESVRRLQPSADRKRVTGVVTDKSVFDADLVADASGRGSRSASWLESLGFTPPRDERVNVDLVYTTRLFRLKTGALNDRFVVIAPTPEGKRGGVIGQQEGGIWIVTLFGHFGNVAPTDLQGFISYARSLPAPFIYDAIHDAEPISQGCQFRFPASGRRRYEELDRFPDGFLVFGDAVCSFNPIYGQGMSVAALQAKVLQEILQQGETNIAKTFFKKAAKVIDNPWNIAVGGDLKMPETIGPRGIGVRAINWYLSKLHKCAHRDADAAIAFIRVAQLLAGPESLMRPGMIWRVLSANIRDQRQDRKPTMAAQEVTQP